MERFTPYQSQQIPPPIPPTSMPPMPREYSGFPSGRLGGNGGGGGGRGGAGAWLTLGFTVLVLCVAAALIFAKARSIAQADVVGPRPDTTANRRLAAAEAKYAQSQLMLYGLQHGDRLPDFRQYPNWEQLTQTTDPAGRPSGGTTTTQQFRYGPYMQKKPVNPLNGLSTVFVAPDGRGPGTKLPPGKTAGFVLYTRSGKLYFTDPLGTTVITENSR